jgi:hypothetical protein
MLSSLIHFLIYPLDTIKTRVISSNKISDIAKFNYNQTKTQTAYLGIFRGYFSMLIGSGIHLAIGRDNMLQGAVIEGVLKTWIDMMKISKQMANKSADLSIMKSTFGVAAVYGVARDVAFRGGFFFLVDYLNKKLLHNNKFDEGRKLNNMFFATILATIISQPLEVCFVKVASQRQKKYTNLFTIPIEIVKEEGFGKLIASGLWPRIVFNLLSTTILYNSYNKMLDVSLEAL